MAIKMTDVALNAAKNGLSVIPIENGKKKAKTSWTKFQNEIATEAEIRSMFSEGDWLAIPCGKASGNLEAVDFDATELYPEWRKLMEEYAPDILPKFLVQQTPSQGFHVLYRCEAIEGNLKLANQENGEVAIETRGQGGYILAAPTPGYKIIQGDFKRIPTITPDERDLVLALCRTHGYKPVESHHYESNPGISNSVKRPGEDYGQRTQWADILTGWTQGRTIQGRTQWVRPGKKARDGIGATTGHGENDLLYVFTSNAPPFAPGCSYSKFAAYALLNHGGDFHFAAQVLRGKGYGTPADSYIPNITREQLYEKRESSFLKLSDVQGKPVDWLFDRRFAKGMLSAVQGDPGEGKSTIARAVATMVTTGHAPGFWGMNLDGPRDVIWLTKEESLTYSVVPVLQAMGADLTRIHALNMDLDEEGKMPPDFIFDDWGIQQLRELIEATEAALIVIDPLVAFFDSKTDIHKQNETRKTLARLIVMAEQTKCVPLGIVHQSKAKNSNALLNILGSVDFGAAIRTGFLVGHDPDDRNKKAFVQTKSNLGPFADPIGFEIADDGAILWDEHCTLDAERLNEPPSVKAQKAKANACTEWLESELSFGQYEVAALLERAKGQGFSKPTLYRAADELRVSRGTQPTPGRGRGPAWWAKTGFDWTGFEWPDPFE